MVNFNALTELSFLCVCEWKVGSVVVPVAPDGLFPAIGMHSLGEEVRLDLQAEWGSEEDDSVMMVDSHEDEWARLYDVRVIGTVSGGWPSQTKCETNEFHNHFCLCRSVENVMS